MAATTVQRRPKWLGEHGTRHGATSILRGTKFEAGWLIANHDGRLMAYPDGGFDNALTAVNGGPLQVPGADANGGLRIIAKRRNVTFTLTNGTLGVSVTNHSIVLTCPVASTTALAAKQYLLERYSVAELIDVGFSGTGAGLVATIASTAVPCVTLFGVSKVPVDASTMATDTAIVVGSALEAQGDTGCFGLIFNGAPYPGCKVAVINNNEVSTLRTPLCLEVECVSVLEDLAFCEVGE
jgi:hypothetical protein